MKDSRTIRRLGLCHVAVPVEVSEDRLVIRFPDPRLISLVARSVLLVTAIVSLPWLRAAARNAADDTAAAAAAATLAAARPEEAVFFPMLLRDLSRHGHLKSGGYAIFVGHSASRLSKPLMKKYQLDLVSDERMPAIPDGAVDFVFIGEDFGESGRRFADRVLKVGGFVAFRLATDPANSFKIPSNYMMAYVRQFGSIIVGLRKTSDEVPNAANSPAAIGRQLLAVREAKKEALEGLEDALLEPPISRRMKKTATRYLPDLTGDSLDGYPRRVFVDVGAPGRAASTRWFKKWYPTRNRKFEMIIVDVALSAVTAAEDWLERNVKAEEYVVMKAEAEVVEELLKGEAMSLVDELFLECKNDHWHRKGLGKNKWAYWECLVLYGKLRDHGVAVHQWWG